MSRAAKKIPARVRKERKVRPVPKHPCLDGVEGDAAGSGRKIAPAALTFADLCPNNMVFIHCCGRIVFANRLCEEIMGYTSEEFYAPHFDFLTLIAPEYREIMRRQYEKHMRGEEFPILEYVLVAKDGRRIQALLSTRLVEYQGKRAILGLVSNVTKHTVLETRLREERDLSQRYLDTAGVMFLVLNPDTTVRLVNRRGADVLGYAERDIVGKPWVDHFVPEIWRPKVRDVFAAIVAGRAPMPERFENPVLTRGGEERLIEWRNALLRDPRGRITGVLSSGLDVTVERKAVQALQESENRYRSLMENMPVGVYRTTPDGQILMANEVLVRKMGYSSFHEVARINLEREGFPPDTSRKAFIEKIEKAGEVRGFEAKWLRKDGAVVYVRENARAVRDEKGKTLYYEGTVENITEEKLAERELARRADIEGRVAQAAMRLSRLKPGESLRTALRETLRSLAEFLGTDRAYVYVMEEGGEAARAVCEWTTAGAVSFTEKWPCLRACHYSWMAGQRNRQDVVFFARRQDLPAEAAQEAAFFKREGIASFLHLPLECSGRMVGSLTFDSGKEGLAVPPAILEQIRVAGETIASALERERADAELRFRVEFENVISSISTRFVNIAAEQVDATIRQSLRAIGEFAQVDRCYVYRILDEGKRVKLAHEWCRPGVDPMAPERQEILFTEVPWGVGRLMEGEIVHVPSVSQVPPEAETEARHMETNGIRSMLCVPFVVGGRGVGFIGLVTESEERAWPDEMAALLKIVGEIFANAIGLRNTSAALDEEHRLLTALMENLPDTVYFKDAKSRFIRVNRKMAQKHGDGTPEGLRGKTDFDLFTAEHAEQAFRDELRILATGEPLIGLEEKETWTDGTVTWVSTTKAPLRDLDGRIVGTFGISRDITDRKKHEAVLETERGLLRTLIDSIPGSYVFIKNRRSEFVTTNKAHLAVLGRTGVEQVVGKTDFDFFDRSLAEKYYRDEQEVMESGHARLNYEETTVDEKGQTQWLLTSKVPLRDAADRVTGLLGISTDTTALKRVELERSRMEARVFQAQKLESLGLFSSGIAHDFNNLLMGILGNTNMALVAIPQDSPAWSSVKQAESIALRAADLTNQMLAFAGKSQLVLRPVNLTETVRETLRLLETSVPKTVKVECELAPEPIVTEGDPMQMRQVVMNLLTNACDAIRPRSGTVRFRTGAVACDAAYLSSGFVGGDVPPGTYAFLEVADTGCGMDAQTVARVFEPFFTTKKEGRGLGLSNVLGIVRSHKGALKVYSEVGKGTTFRILLPLSTRKVETVPARKESALVWRGSGTVLVVDDDEIVRTVTAQILSKMGFAVLTAADGTKAMEHVAQGVGKMAAVLLDLTLPGTSGADMLAEIRKTDPDVPVLLISGYNEQYATRDIPAGRYSCFLQKPFDAEMLARRLRDVVERPKPRA